MNIIADNGVNKTLFSEAYDCNLKLICVGNDNLKSKLLSRVNDKLKTVKIVSKPNEIVNNTKPGVTTTNFNHEINFQRDKDIIKSVNIDIYDSKFYTRFYIKNLLHTEAHELFHMFSALVPGIMKNNKNIYYENGNLYYNCIGNYMVYKNNESVELGLMFTETLTDLLATISLNTYSPHYYKRDTANKILRTNHFVGIENISDYTFFTSMTRLALAAFNNDPNVDYDSMILNGQNLFFSRIKGRNGQILMKNDLLYGYMADPLHTKREFEKIIGPESYDKFIYALDEVFKNALNTNSIDKDKIKLYMKVLPNFLNLMLKKYKQLGIFNDDDIVKITSNFNKIWNEIKKEYGVYFTKKEINEFYSCNIKYNLIKGLTL